MDKLRPVDEKHLDQQKYRQVIVSCLYYNNLANFQLHFLHNHNSTLLKYLQLFDKHKV